MRPIWSATTKTEAISKAEARKLEQESHVHGERALRTHIGEVFLEIGIVLASLAILTKRRQMWYVIDAQCGGGLGYRYDGFAGALAIRVPVEHPPYRSVAACATIVGVGLGYGQTHF